MKRFAHIYSLLLLSLIPACAAYNSSSSDPTLYNEATLQTGGDPNFASAYRVITTRCSYCHIQPSHAQWNNLTSNSLWVASGYVIKGSASTSPLILKCFLNGTGNMPQSNDMTQAEFDQLKTWINNMP
jgi:uncharacterized membrane protein